MRTTVDLADDVAAAVARLRREKGLGLSEAVNELVRTGLNAKERPYVYRHQTYDMGAQVDLANIGEVLELLDQAGDADRGESTRHAD